MRLPTVLAALVLGFGLALPAAAQIRLDDGSVLTPYERDPNPITTDRQQALAEQPAWQTFTQQHGSWMALFNEATGTPQRAIGVARIPGHPTVSARTAETAARAFIGQHPEVFGAAPEALELIRLVDAGDRFFVGFRQRYAGLPVAFSEVQLVLFANGNVPMIGAVTYRDIPALRSAALGPDAARAAATDGLAFQSARDVTETDGELYILPVRDGQSITYHLAYEVWVRTHAPAGFFRTFVDATDGTVHYRNNLVLSVNPDATTTHHHGHDHAGHDHGPEASASLAEQLADTMLPSRRALQGAVTGGTFSINPFGETEQQRPFARQRLSVGGTQVTADRDGLFSLDGFSGEAAVTAQLAGSNFTVNRDNGPNASFTGTAVAGQPFSLAWDDSNSAANERNGYFHAMAIRLYLEDLYATYAGPGQVFDYLNFLMPVNVGLQGNCNAFWNGSSINFFRPGGGCPDIALLASVVYHEYGHGVNQWLYNRLGSGSMGNRAANEATADVMSNVIEDDPRVGRGFSGGTSVLRNCQNNVVYPQNFDSGTGLGADYNNSRILCGAFWRVRQNTDLETFRYLAHFSKYSTPDDQNTVVAFSEWFVSVLVADDDDGDLSNGTPNFDAIVAAFGHHGIGLNLLLPSSIAHTPLTDQPGGAAPQAVVTVNPLAVGDGTITLVYSLDGFETETTLPMTPSGTPGQFVGQLPTLATGAIVSYYVRAQSSHGVEVLLPATAPAQPYSFLVGYVQELFDPMEGATSNWTAGAPDDTATQGLWERGAPQQVIFGNSVVQPPFDHTPGLTNTRAWITGREAGANAFANTVRTGKTTLFSPIYDVSESDFAVFRFYLWYFNQPTGDPFEISLSNDGGASWTVVYDSPRTTNGWELVSIPAHTVMPLTGQMQLRFVAQNVTPSLSIVNALVDDFEIMLAGGGTVSAEDDATVTAFSLDALYPNPTAGASATMAFSLPVPQSVQVEVFDLLGRRLATAAEGTFPAGRHTVALDTGALAGGTYVVRLRAGADVATTRLTIVR